MHSKKREATHPGDPPLLLCVSPNNDEAKGPLYSKQKGEFSALVRRNLW
jgi:hypothetical protein